MTGEQCPYCDDKNPKDLRFAGGFATKDKHSPYQLEYCHDLKCDNWFIVVRDIRTGNIIANFKRPEQWESKLLIPPQEILDAEEVNKIYSQQLDEDE
jgi:hypothetical protein